MNKLERLEDVVTDMDIRLNRIERRGGDGITANPKPKANATQQQRKDQATEELHGDDGKCSECRKINYMGKQSFLIGLASPGSDLCESHLHERNSREIVLNRSAC